LKIQDAYFSGAAPSQLNKTQQSSHLPAARTEADKQAAATASDTVGLSELSQRLWELARKEPSQRVAHIERLAELVRSGRYQVDALALSQRLVEEALQRPI